MTRVVGYDTESMCSWLVPRTANAGERCVNFIVIQFDFRYVLTIHHKAMM